MSSSWLSIRRLPASPQGGTSFLEHVVGEPAIVYGHSLGGEVALTVAAEHPSLVRAVIDGDAPLSIENHPTEEPAHNAMNQLWHQLAGCPVAAIATALRDLPMHVPGGGPPQRAIDVFGEGNPWFAFQAHNLHQLDSDMLAAVLAGPAVMLEGYDSHVLLPAIRCPVLLLQGDPRAGELLRHEDVELGMRLLAHARHVWLDGLGHELHGPAEQALTVLEAMTPFLLSV